MLSAPGPDGDGDASGAEEILQRATALARRQGAISLELRCAIDLATVCLRTGSSVGRRLLARAVSELDANLDTPDKREAEALLEQLGEPRLRRVVQRRR